MNDCQIQFGTKLNFMLRSVISQASVYATFGLQPKNFFLLHRFAYRINVDIEITSVRTWLEKASPYLSQFMCKDLLPELDIAQKHIET